MATIDTTRPAELVASSGGDLKVEVASTWDSPTPAGDQYVGDPAADITIAERAGARVVDEYPETLRKLAE